MCFCVLRKNRSAAGAALNNEEEDADRTGSNALVCSMKKAIVIGAGPAGLTAALEFLRKTGVKPIVLEASEEIGGISRTIRYKGNRMDIGGHRFFSKSDRVMQWWMDLMPVESGEG